MWCVGCVIELGCSVCRWYEGGFFFLLYLSYFSFPCAVGSDFKIAICGGNFSIRVSGDMEGRFDYCFGMVGWAGVLCMMGFLGFARTLVKFLTGDIANPRTGEWLVIHPWDFVLGSGVLALLALKSAIFSYHGL